MVTAGGRRGPGFTVQRDWTPVGPDLVPFGSFSGTRVVNICPYNINNPIIIIMWQFPGQGGQRGLEIPPFRKKQLPVNKLGDSGPGGRDSLKPPTWYSSAVGRSANRRRVRGT